MAKKKIDPLNKKAYGAVSAALTVSDIPAAVSFYQKAFGFTKRGIMNGPDGKPMHAELILRGTTSCWDPKTPRWEGAPPRVSALRQPVSTSMLKTSIRCRQSDEAWRHHPRAGDGHVLGRPVRYPSGP